MGFSIFLGVVENIIYLVACGLGIYCMEAVRRAYGERPFAEEPVANHTNEELGGAPGFAKRAGRERNDDEI